MERIKKEASRLLKYESNRFALPDGNLLITSEEYDRITKLSR